MDIAAMFFHDALRSIEAEARSLSDSLSREERLEDVLLNVRWNTRAVVADFHHHPSILAISANSQLAFAIHRIDGVVDDVRPNLIQFAAEGVHQQRNTLIVSLHLNAPFELVIKDGQCRLQALHDVDV